MLIKFIDSEKENVSQWNLWIIKFRPSKRGHNKGVISEFYEYHGWKHFRELEAIFSGMFCEQRLFTYWVEVLFMPIEVGGGG